MVALTAARDTPSRAGKDIFPGVAAAAVIFSGALVCRNATGFAVPGSTSTTLLALGRAKASVTGTATNGEVNVPVEAGTFRWANHGADLVTIADRGNDCFIVDDQTVARTNGGATRSVAGKVVAVDAEGVWVSTGIVVAG